MIFFKSQNTFEAVGIFVIRGSKMRQPKHQSSDSQDKSSNSNHTRSMRFCPKVRDEHGDATETNVVTSCHDSCFGACESKSSFQGTDADVDEAIDKHTFKQM